MKYFLTNSQRHWLTTKKVEIDELYSFPTWGFVVWTKPYGEYFHLHTNPLTRSLSSEFFLVKEIRSGYARGNFYHNPKGPDFWIAIDEIENRDLIEILLLAIISCIPLALWNIGRVLRIKFLHSTK